MARFFFCAKIESQNTFGQRNDHHSHLLGYLAALKTSSFYSNWVKCKNSHFFFEIAQMICILFALLMLLWIPFCFEPWIKYYFQINGTLKSFVNITYLSEENVKSVRSDKFVFVPAGYGYFWLKMTNNIKGNMSRFLQRQDFLIFE